MPRIMIVDDSAFMRKILTGILKKAGYKDIVEADDGKIAVETYAAGKPDLVLLDIVMQTSGIDALKQIRASDPGAKVIMVTAVGQESMIDEAMEAGALAYIVKPFREDKVIEAVKGALS